MTDAVVEALARHRERMAKIRSQGLALTAKLGALNARLIFSTANGKVSEKVKIPEEDILKLEELISDVGTNDPRGDAGGTRPAG